MRQPFISFYTPTYRRPDQLRACMESVRTQTAVADVEQVIIPDYVGIGVGGTFARVPLYAPALRGRYVHFLCDDDVLAAPDVVARLRALAAADEEPEIIIVGAQKPGGYYPDRNQGPPVLGSIDLGCFVVRGDVWKAHCHRYGHSYEGDYSFIAHLWEVSQAGEALRWAWHKELHFSTGAASRGRFEGQWP